MRGSERDPFEGGARQVRHSCRRTPNERRPLVSRRAVTRIIESESRTLYFIFCSRIVFSHRLFFTSPHGGVDTASRALQSSRRRRLADACAAVSATATQRCPRAALAANTRQQGEAPCARLVEAANGRTRGGNGNDRKEAAQHDACAERRAQAGEYENARSPELAAVAAAVGAPRDAEQQATRRTEHPAPCAAAAAAPTSARRSGGKNARADED